MTALALHWKETLAVAIGGLVVGLLASFILTNSEPALLLILPALLVLYFIAQRPILGIYILIPLAVFVPPAPQEIGALELGYMGILAFTLLAWLVRFRLSQYISSSLTSAIIFLFTLIFVSFFVRTLYGTSLYHWIRGIIPFLNFAVFYLVMSELRHQRDLQRLLWVFRITAVCVFILVAGSVLPVLGKAISARNIWEIRSALENGSFGTFTVMLPAFLFALWMSKHQRSKLDLVLLLGMLLIVLVTFLRSALLILGLTGLMVLWRSVRTSGAQLLRRIALPSVASIACIAAVYVVSPQARSFFDLIYEGFAYRFGVLNTMGDVRSYEAQEVFSHFQKAPVIGHGLGFQYSYDRSKFMGIGRKVIWEGGYTHNAFTYFMLVFGVIGIVALLWLIWAAWLEYRKCARRPLDEASREYLFATGIALLATFLYGNFQSVLRSVTYLFVVSVLLGVIVKLGRLESDQPTSPSE
jgi:O-antigen ligase